MRGGLIALLFFVVAGVMLANAIANPKGTKVLFDGVNSFWKTNVNGLLAHAS